MAPTRLNRKFKQLRGSETVLGDESAKSGSEEPVDRGNNSGDTIGESDSDGTSDNESGSDDAPEAESLSGGRAAEDTRAGALKRHEEKLHELRKIKNKAREEFIRSTKASKLPAVDDSENHATPGGVDTENENDGEIANEVLQSDRLPDSIFAVAHESLQESTERKRMNKPSRDVPAKRRRLREVPVEKVVNGRALRVAVDINAPPAISFTSTRKVKNSAKGGSAFRRKWKKVDAMRAQKTNFQLRFSSTQIQASVLSLDTMNVRAKEKSYSSLIHLTKRHLRVAISSYYSDLCQASPRILSPATKPRLRSSRA